MLYLGVSFIVPLFFSINDVLVSNNGSLDMITTASNSEDLLFDVTQYKAVKEVRYKPSLATPSMSFKSQMSNTTTSWHVTLLKKNPRVDCPAINSQKEITSQTD